MAYLFGTNDNFIKGASASGFMFGISESPDASLISLPAPGSGLMFGPYDINNNANHVNVGTIETLPGIDLNPAYLKDGLWREKFNGYMNDDVNYFANNTPIPMNNYGSSTFADTFGGFGSQQIGLDQGINIDPVYSLQWTGFFLAPTTGVYTFYTISDDCSFLWLGDNAKNGNFTRANALVDNGGAHGSSPKVASHSVHLTAGKYYHMRIQFGEAGGGESCMVFYSNNAGQTKVTDIRNKMYYDEVNTILQ